MRTRVTWLIGGAVVALLLLAGAYYHDSMRTSTVASGPNATDNRPMVNWDVVESNWNSFKVVKLLPLEGDEHQYRIKNTGEAFERVAKESQLDRFR